MSGKEPLRVVERNDKPLMVFSWGRTVPELWLAAVQLSIASVSTPTQPYPSFIFSPKVTGLQDGAKLKGLRYFLDPWLLLIVLFLA